MKNVREKIKMMSVNQIAVSGASSGFQPNQGKNTKS